jgi:hypothetical protein
VELIHATGMQAGYTMGMEPSGREHLVVCVKGTYTIPQNGEVPILAEEQVPLVEADEFTGEPGFSAPLRESDYPLRKPNCDVLLNGSAYAPGGKPATKVPVVLQVGPIKKSFYVIGDRVWRKGWISAKPSSPMPFLKMPITYDRAFGGIDDNHEDPNKLVAYTPNPVGVGYHRHLKKEYVDGKPLPNTEEPNSPIKMPNGAYRPRSFGPVGRNWPQRLKFAGTYDQDWLDDIFPFLPPDFDERYFQSAPLDQQMPYPTGGEIVALLNLTPEGNTTFKLPDSNLLVWFLMKNGEEEEVGAVIDTILIEPEENRFMITWRASTPLKRNMFEIVQVIIGPDPEDRYQGREETDSVFPLVDVPETEEVE